MTNEQLEQCKTCLHRKKGTFEADEICSITDFTPTDGEACPKYVLKPVPALLSTNKLEALKPNANRAKYVMIAILVVMFLDLITAISEYFQYNLLLDLKDGIYVSDEMITNNDLRKQVIAIFYTIAFITSAVFFIMWFRRAYYNLSIRTENTYYGEGWAAGSWFLPIISLFRPYQIMKELDEDTSELLSKATKQEVDTNSFIIGTWWTLWILINYFGQTLIKRLLQGESINDFINLTVLDMVNSCLGIPLALITYFMIKNYANKEAALVTEENRKPETPTETAF
ncbi:DUF4328 domain-containing protein [Flavobacterium sp.]|uniref:DUF4328 domain-containing protein n=1 Tax=Flavobacterium sp. TaxID=239 RepID=UPI00261C8D24|nr:DUF4328 domain-containing protein [Flavobacterium sp.]